MTWSRRSASLAISGCPPRFQQCHDRDHPLALSVSRPSRDAVVSWEALARLPHSSLTRVFWTCPARESKVGTCSPRPPSGRRRDARSEPPRRVPRKVLMKLSSDVRRCREELPEAARRRLPWLITAARRQAAHSPV